MRSRAALTPLAWVLASAFAACPTWDTWRPVAQGEHAGEVIYGCVGRFPIWEFKPFHPLRNDLDVLITPAATWGVPVLVVLVATGAAGAAGPPVWPWVVTAVMGYLVVTLPIAVAGIFIPAWPQRLGRGR